MNCKLFSRLEVAEALALVQIAEELGFDPAKITTDQVTKAQVELARRRRPGIIKTLFEEEPLFGILDGAAE